MSKFAWAVQKWVGTNKFNSEPHVFINVVAAGGRKASPIMDRFGRSFPSSVSGSGLDVFLQRTKRFVFLSVGGATKFVNLRWKFS